MFLYFQHVTLCCPRLFLLYPVQRHVITDILVIRDYDTSRVHTRACKPPLDQPRVMVDALLFRGAACTEYRCFRTFEVIACHQVGKPVAVFCELPFPFIPFCLGQLLIAVIQLTRDVPRRGLQRALGSICIRRCN